MSSQTFSLQQFQSLSAAAQRLGLRGDVAAAQHTLERRKRLVAMDMQRKASYADAETVQRE